MANIPSDCAPGGPRIDADLEDFVHWGEDMRFTPDDAKHPRGGEPEYVLGPGSDEDVAMEAFHRGEPFYTRSDEQGFMSQAFNSFKVRSELFKELEARTKIPFWKWYDAIESARSDVDLAKSATIKELDEWGRGLRNKNERQQAQMLIEAKYGREGFPELSEKVNPRVVKAAEELEGVYRRYFENNGVSAADVDEFFRAFPQVRQHDGEFSVYSTHQTAIPKLMTFMSKQFKTGEAGILDNREYDAWAIGRKIISAHANQTYLMPAWEATSRQAKAYASTGQIPGELFDYFTEYTKEVRHVPDHMQQSLTRFVSKVNKQLFGGKLPIGDNFDVASSLLGWNYYANMAWNPGIAMRNYLQTVMTTYPLAGEKYLAEGLAFYAKGVRGGKHQGQEIADLMTRRGVLTRDNIPEAVYAMRDKMRETGGDTGLLGGKASDVANWMIEKGWMFHRSAENLNRTTAYWSMYRRTEDFGQMFMDKKINWEQFVEKSHLDFLDVKGGGPFVEKVKGLMMSGDLEKAAHTVGLASVARTQFVYSAGNNAYAFSGTMGRMLGQFSTWPTWYGHYIGSMFTRGTTKNKVAMLGRWTAANAAVFYGAKEVFGTDTAKWTFFSPFGYQGGPLAQMGIQAMTAGGSAMGEGKVPFIGMLDPITGMSQSPDDPVARIQQGRLMKSYQQVIPGVPWSALRTGDRLWGDIANEESWQNMTKHFLGFQAADEE